VIRRVADRVIEFDATMGAYELVASPPVLPAEGTRR
jgi:hypothetical protein